MKSAAKLLEFAIQAPSTHNTQPWIFCVEGRAVRFEADFARWLRVADPQKRELFLSVGCALENFLIALEHEKLGYRVRYGGIGDPEFLAAQVEISEGAAAPRRRAPELFEAIPRRLTDRKPFRKTPLRQEDIAALHACSLEEGIGIDLRDDPRILTVVDEYMQLADAIQFADPAYRDELGFWIGQGVYGAPWLLSKMGQLAVSQIRFGKLRVKRDCEALQGAPTFGVLYASRDDRASLVKAGQTLQRVWLRATSLGIGLQPMSQIVEIPALAAQLAALLDARGIVPLQPFRLGYADLKGKRPPRRALAEFVRPSA